MRKNLLCVTLVQAVIYVLQYLLFPNLFSNLFPRSNEAFLLFAATLCLVSIIEYVLLNLKLSNIAVGIVVYFLLIAIYCPEGAYGIGLKGLTLDGMQATYSYDLRWGGIFVATIITGIIQIILWSIIIFLKKIFASKQ